MYARECERTADGLARMIPKLRETHIIRDSWTKLNVAPAKIMQVYIFHVVYMAQCSIHLHVNSVQQEQVITELYSHTKSNPQPLDVDSTRCTLQYLEACNRIFERGFLSHERVLSVDSKVIESISVGFKFFCEWLDKTIETGK